MGSLVDSYSSIRTRLDKMGYREAFGIESLALVEHLFLDLLKTTQNLQKYFQEYDVHKKISKELQDGLEPFKKENLRLVKENSQLRLAIQRSQEKVDEKLQGSKSRLRDLETENTELKLLVGQFVERVKQQDIESLAKTRKMAQLQERNLQANVIMRDGDKNCAAVRRQQMEIDDPAPKSCPHCIRIRNFVRFGLKHDRDPIPIDYIKVADSRIEALTLQNRSLKATQQDLMELIKSMKFGLEMRESELEKLKFDMKLVVPSIRDGTEKFVAGGDRDIESYEGKDVHIALKSAQLQLQVLQKRNLNLEKRLQHSFLQRPDYMLHGSRSAAERHLIVSTFDDNGEYLFLPNENITVDEKLRLLETQLSHCCQEKAKLKALLEQCERKHQQRRTTPERDGQQNGTENDLPSTKTGTNISSARPSQQTSQKKISDFLAHHQIQVNKDSKKLSATKSAQLVKPIKQNFRNLPRPKSTVNRIQNGLQKSKMDSGKIIRPNKNKNSERAENDGTLRNGGGRENVYRAPSSRPILSRGQTTEDQIQHQAQQRTSKTQSSSLILERDSNEDEESENLQDEESVKKIAGRPFVLRGEYDGESRGTKDSRRNFDHKSSKQQGNLYQKSSRQSRQPEINGKRISNTRKPPNEVVDPTEYDDYHDEEAELSEDVEREETLDKDSFRQNGFQRPSSSRSVLSRGKFTKEKIQNKAQQKPSKTQSSLIQKERSDEDDEFYNLQDDDESVTEAAGPPFILRGEYDMENRRIKDSKRKLLQKPSKQDHTSEIDRTQIDKKRISNRQKQQDEEVEPTRYANSNDEEGEASDDIGEEKSGKGSVSQHGFQRPNNRPVVSRGKSNEAQIQLEVQRKSFKPQPSSTIQELNSEEEFEDLDNQESIKEITGPPFVLRGEYDVDGRQLKDSKSNLYRKSGKRSGPSRNAGPLEKIISNRQSQRRPEAAQKTKTYSLNSDDEEEKGEKSDDAAQDKTQASHGQHGSRGPGKPGRPILSRGKSTEAHIPNKAQKKTSKQQPSSIVQELNSEEEFEDLDNKESIKEITGPPFLLHGEYDVDGRKLKGSKSNLNLKSGKPQGNVRTSESSSRNGKSLGKRMSNKPSQYRPEATGGTKSYSLNSDDDEEEEEGEENEGVQKDDTRGLQGSRENVSRPPSRPILSRGKSTEVLAEQKLKAQSLATQELTSDIEEFEDVDSEESLKEIVGPSFALRGEYDTEGRQIKDSKRKKEPPLKEIPRASNEEPSSSMGLRAKESQKTYGVRASSLQRREQDPYPASNPVQRRAEHPGYPTDMESQSVADDSKKNTKTKNDDTTAASYWPPPIAIAQPSTSMGSRDKESPPKISSFRIPTMSQKAQDPYQSKQLGGYATTETEFPRHGGTSKVSTPWSSGYGHAPEGSRNREDAFPEYNQPYTTGRMSPTAQSTEYSRSVGYKPYSSALQNVEAADSREMQQRIRSLERIIDDMKMKANLVDASKSDLENEVLKLRRALAECQEHGQQLKSEIQRAKIMLEQTEALLKDTQRKAAANYVPTQRENQELNAQVRQLLAKEMILEREVSTLTNTVKAIDRDKDEMRVELDRKDEKLARMQAENAKHFDELSKLQLQLKNAELQSSHTGEAFRDQERELTLLRREREDMKRELDKRIRERDLAQRDLTALTQSTSKRELEKRYMTEELEKKGKESDDLKKQIQKYIEEVRRIEDLLMKKDEEMEILMDNYRALSQEKGALESQRNMLERQTSSARDVLDCNSALTNKIASQADLIHSYEEEISNLSGQVAGLENQLRTLRDTEKLLRVDVKAARDLSLKLETKLDSMRLEVANAESAKNKVEAENAELQDNIDLMASQLTSDEEKHKKLEDLLTKMREKEYQSEQINSGVTSERDVLVSRLATVNARVEQLGAEAERYRLRSAELQNELEKMKRQYQNEKIERETALNELKRIQAQLSTSSTNLLMSSAMGASRTPSPGHIPSAQQGPLMTPDVSPVMGQSSRDTLIPSPVTDRQ